MAYQSFEELQVWKKSARLSAKIYKQVAELKDFGFKDQLTRSGLSIPSNIAEGYERGTTPQVVNFLNYAKGSAGELRTQIYIGMDIGYIDPQTGKYWLEEVQSISKMLYKLIKARQNTLNP